MLKEIQSKSAAKEKERLSLVPQHSDGSSKDRVNQKDASIDYGQQIALDSAPVGKVDRRKLMLYTYLLQDDAANKKAS